MTKINLDFIYDKLKKTINIKNFNIKKTTTILITIAISYGLANIFSSYTVKYIQNIDSISKTQPVNLSYSSKSPKHQNFREIKKHIIDRNIFNITGEYPEEEDNNSKEVSSKFSLKGPCPNSKLKQTLLGTIYSDNNKSLAIIKDLGDNYIDYYKTGDTLINNTQVKIAAILEGKVILNNNSHKECLLTKGSVKKQSKEKEVETITTSIELKNKWVTKQIGPGYATILQSTPYGPTSDGSPGISLFFVEGGSLFDKIGLKANDTIKEINGKKVSILDELVLYKIFEETRKIKILFTRGSATKIVDITIK
jgi:type II secretory pathway component PulC